MQPLFQAIRPLIDANWDMFTEMFASTVVGKLAGDEARHYAALLRECVTPDTAKVVFEAINSYDVYDLLPDVRSQTLIMHPALSSFVDLSAARDLAARIPDARLVVLEGDYDVNMFNRGEKDLYIATINDFLGYRGESKMTQTSSTEVHPSPTEVAFRTILFTDIVGHTEMMQRLGDEKGRALLREHERITREVLRAHGGNEVKTMGDGFMASFGSVTKAVECAIALQRAFAAWNRGEGGGLDPRPSTLDP